MVPYAIDNIRAKNWDNPVLSGRKPLGSSFEPRYAPGGRHLFGALIDSDGPNSTNIRQEWSEGADACQGLAVMGGGCLLRLWNNGGGVAFG